MSTSDDAARALARQLEANRLRHARRRQRRLASVAFLLAGIAFGSALYVVRAHFDRTFADPHRRLALAALVLFMVLLFWFGARSETEVGSLDAQIQELAEVELRERSRRS